MAIEMIEISEFNQGTQIKVSAWAVAAATLSNT